MHLWNLPLWMWVSIFLLRLLWIHILSVEILLRNTFWTLMGWIWTSSTVVSYILRWGLWSYLQLFFVFDWIRLFSVVMVSHFPHSFLTLQQIYIFVRLIIHKFLFLLTKLSLIPWIASNLTWFQLMHFFRTIKCSYFSHLDVIQKLGIFFFLKISEILHDLVVNLFVLGNHFLVCYRFLEGLRLLLVAIHPWSAWAQLLLMLVLLSSLNCKVAWLGLSSTNRSSSNWGSWGLSSQWIHVLIFRKHIAFIDSPRWVLSSIGWSCKCPFQSNPFGVHNYPIRSHLLGYLLGGISLVDHHLAWSFVVQPFLLEYLCNR